MIDQNEAKERNSEMKGRPLGEVMDAAESQVKVKSAEKRKGLGDEVVAKAVSKESGKDKDIAGKEKGAEKFDFTPQQKDIIERLNSAKGSEERVRTFAKIADDIGLDALVSLIPELGDAGSSIVSGLYLLCEAKKAGLGTMSYVKIIGLQVADFFAGAIPVIGDVADYFFKANKWSAASFEKKTQELIKKARKAGVPEEEIAKITQSAEKLPRLVSRAVNISGQVIKKTNSAKN